jgi:zinc/manganese transport system permease protein
MWMPFAACLILTGIHAYLGIHVIERQVIFVDLALAQIAALGAVFALLFGIDPYDPKGYALSLAATFLGAGTFALSRQRSGKIPQEAIIGIIYVMAAAGAILILDRTAEGDEHIRNMLVGNILLVRGKDLIYLTVLYSLIGTMLWRFHKTFHQISTRPAEAYEKKIPVRFWDLVFYLSFGFVVTSSVRLAGVLLVFSYLIVPAVIGTFFASSFRGKLLVGWGAGFTVSLLGIGLSYFLDLPTAATIVCVFGGFLILLGLGKALVRL